MMAITFRRERHAASSFVDTVKALPSGWTGAVHASARGSEAVVYFYEGDIYAAQLSGFRPAINRRLQSSGVITTARANAWDEVVASGNDPVQLALDEGWCSLAQLNVVRQEYVLASVSAISAASGLDFDLIADEVTSMDCCLPLPLVDAMQVVVKRAERLGSDARLLASLVGVNVEGDPAMYLASLPWQQNKPQQLELNRAVSCEALALVAALENAQSLDGAAASCGFTRAEVMHLAGAATSAGLIALAPEDFLSGSFSPRMDVPEAWPLGT